MIVEDSLSAWLCFLQKVLVIDLIVFATVCALYLGAGWRTVQQFSTGLTLVGTLLIVIGGYSCVGNVSASRSIDYPYGETAGKAIPYERIDELIEDAAQNDAFFCLMGVAGILAIVFGELIRVALG